MAVVGTAIGMMLGGSAVAMAVGSIAGNLLISVAATALQRALMGQQDAPEPPGIKTRTRTTGDSTPQSFVLGTYATAGNLTAPPMAHGRSGGTPNAYITYVYDLSDMPATGLRAMWLEDERPALGDPLPVGGIFPGFRPVSVGKFAGLAWVRFYDGTQTAASDHLLTINHPDRPWTADMIGRGIAYAVCVFKYDDEVWRGEPQPLFEVDGIRLHDPRTGTSVFTHNPAVMIYNILRGITLPDGTRWGGEAAASDLPAANWFAAMNECDRIVGGEPQYRAGTEVRVGPKEMGGHEPAAVIEELLRCCSGQIAEYGGIWKMRAGPVGMPVAVLTDEDIIVSEDQTFEPFPGLQETYNGVHAQYPEPLEKWVSKEAPPRYNATYEAQDQNRRLVASLSLGACPYPLQVQRLMRAYVEDERRHRRHALTLPPDYAALEPLDAVAWSSARNGYESKVGEVGSAAVWARSLLTRISWRERDPSDYDWTPGYELPSTPAPITTTPIAPLAVPGWTATGTTIADATGAARRPAIALGWDPEQPGARGIAYEIRVAGRLELAAAGTTQNIAAGGLIVTNGILPGAQMEARGRQMISRPALWTEWVPVTIPDVGLTGADLDPTLREIIDAAERDADAAMAAAQQANATATALQAYVDQEVLDVRADLTADINEAVSSIGTAAEATQAAIDARNAAEGYATAAQTSTAAALAAQAAAEAAEALAEQRATAAAVSATGAQGSASAAAGSATTAAAEADEAGTHATAAQAEVVKAQIGVARLLPSDFRDGAVYWTRNLGGDPATAAALATTGVTVGTDGIVTIAADITGNRQVLSRAVVAARPGRRYRISAEVLSVGGVAGANRLQAAVTRLDAAYANLGSWVADLTPTAADTWQTRSVVIAATDPLPAGTTWLRLGARAQNAVTPAFPVQMRSLLIEDVTESEAAGAYAAAAAGSSSSAAVHATNAGTSAAAALASRTAAETARGQAQTSAEDAATAADVAGGHEAAASQSRTLAASSATTAGQHATAASGSASTAATRATEAGAHATAAQAARTAAETARSGAQTAQTQAVAAKDTAEGAAATATTQAGLAASAAMEAQSVIAGGLPSAIGDGSTWTHALAGDPATIPTHQFGGATLSGGVLTLPASAPGNIHVMSRAVLPWVAGRRYRVTAEVRASVLTPLRWRVLIAGLRGDYTNAANVTQGDMRPAAVNTWQAVSQEVTLGTPASNVTQFRLGLYAIAAVTPAGTLDVRSILIEDVTRDALVQGYADAASNSAAQASASATAAGTSAVTAASERQAAQTARAGAEAARTDAVVAKDTAEGAAAGALSTSTMVAQVASRGVSVIRDQFLAEDANWTRWTGQGTLSRPANTVYPLGRDWDFTVTSAQTDGAQIASTTAATWPGTTNASAYAVEVEYSLMSGALTGAAVMVNWLNSVPATYRASMRLSDMQAGSSLSGRTRLARGIFLRPAGFTGTFASNQLVVAINTTLAGEALTAKRIKLHRVQIRPASEEEMGRGQVLSGVLASIATSHMTRAETTGAIADSNTTLTASINGVSGRVTRTETALANLNGSVARFRDVASVDGGLTAAGIEAVAWNTQGQGTGSVLKLIGRNVIAPGSMSVGELTVGFGANMLQDSRFFDGLTHWAIGGTTTQTTLTVRAPGSEWAHTSYPTLMLFQNGANTAAQSQIVYRPRTQDGLSFGVSAGEGQWLCASAYVSLHRCRGRVGVQYLDGAGVQTGLAWSDWQDPIAVFSYNPDRWIRLFAIAQAPAGTAFARILIQKSPTLAGSTDSYLFAWKPQLEPTHGAASLPSLYTSGEVGYFSGDMLFTDRAVIKTVAQMGSAVIGSAQIQDLTVGTIKITGKAINTMLSTSVSFSGGMAGTILASLNVPAFSAQSQFLLGFSANVTTPSGSTTQNVTAAPMARFHFNINGVNTRAIFRGASDFAGVNGNTGEMSWSATEHYPTALLPVEAIAGTNVVQLRGNTYNRPGAAPFLVDGVLTVWEAKR